MTHRPLTPSLVRLASPVDPGALSAITPGLKNKAQWLLGLAVATLAAPAVFWMLQGAIGLGVAGLLGLLGIHGTPYVVQRLQNWSLRLQRAEATAHARDEIEKAFMQDLANLEDDLDASHAKQVECAALAQPLRQMASDTPAQAAHWLERAALLEQVEQLEAQRQQDLKQTIVQARAEHDRALANLDVADAVDAALSARRGRKQSPTDQWRLRTARRCVDQRINRAFAELQLEVRQAGVTPPDSSAPPARLRAPGGAP